MKLIADVNEYDRGKGDGQQQVLIGMMDEHIKEVITENGSSLNIDDFNSPSSYKSSMQSRRLAPVSRIQQRIDSQDSKRKVHVVEELSIEKHTSSISKEHLGSSSKQTSNTL